MLDSPEYKAWLYSGTVEMSLREYLCQVLLKNEPDIAFKECIHDFTDKELEEVINVDDSTTRLTSTIPWFTRGISGRPCVSTLCAMTTAGATSSQRREILPESLTKQPALDFL